VADRETEFLSLNMAAKPSIEEYNYVVPSKEIQNTTLVSNFSTSLKHSSYNSR
jgi:hypothetical protein